ncbi:MAG: hypothetical protein JWL90_2896 [Chthoniobacteraceae bacterium]|nr:hypothetical protein [Chthoniobacteraceae bacterium]
MVIAFAAGFLILHAEAGPYAPAAGIAGSTAVAYDSAGIHGWASGVVEVKAGLQDSSFPALGPVSYGHDSGDGRFPGIDALGPADAQDDSYPVISLGDGGSITLSFSLPITNGAGPDFAVFENGISDTFLELAFVEVSSDGVLFFRFPSVSLTSTTTQIPGFGALDATNLNNLAGKYRRGFGTPFDLAELAGKPGLDVNRILQVRLIDVVGSIDPAYGQLDSQGHLVNDPWTTPYETGGFDLDAIAVLNQVPEPGSAILLAYGMAWIGLRRGSRK